MPDVRPLVDADFEPLYEAFLKGTVAGFDAARYRPMFVRGDGTTAGYGLFDAGRIVGVLGTLVSPRVINGEPHEVCNLHAWFVQPEYRGYSLALLRPALRDKTRTVTDLTPSPAVCAISLKLRFQWLDGRLALLFRPWGRRRDTAQNLEIVTVREQIRGRTTTIDPTVRAAIDDETLTPLLAIDGDGECLVLARRVETRRTYCYVHHLSDAARFARWSVPIRAALLDLCGGSFVAVERRRLGSHSVKSRINLPATTRQLVRPAQPRAIDAAEVDTLRSELQYLGMSTLPGKRLLTSTLAAKFPGLAGVAKRLLKAEG